MVSSDIAYDSIGCQYGRFRNADPRIEATIHDALGDAVRILNVGAGTGSYEPADRSVVAVEPSSTMIRQRHDGAAPAIRAVAEQLPVATGSFDAVMAILTIHHWSDWRAGLSELCRIAPRRLVFTFAPELHNQLWLLRDYFPGALPTPTISRTPDVEEVAELLRTDRIEPVLVPHDCTDGFNWAYWRRPERYLDVDASRSTSVLAQLPDADLQAGLERLAEDLRTGRWHDRYGHLLDLDHIDGGFRLVISDVT